MFWFLYFESWLSILTAGWTDGLSCTRANKTFFSMLIWIYILAKFEHSLAELINYFEIEDRLNWMNYSPLQVAHEKLKYEVLGTAVDKLIIIFYQIEYWYQAISILKQNKNN